MAQSVIDHQVEPLHQRMGWQGAQSNCRSPRVRPRASCYFHSMRHTFKITLGDAGFSAKFRSSVRTAICWRRRGAIRKIETESPSPLGRRHRAWSGCPRGFVDGRPDPDRIVRKSMRKESSWRHAPIHASLIQHGFIEFLRNQQQAGFQHPFQQEWQPREVTSALGQSNRGPELMRVATPILLGVLKHKSKLFQGSKVNGSLSSDSGESR